jgi:hypothetical protein
MEKHSSFQQLSSPEPGPLLNHEFHLFINLLVYLRIYFLTPLLHSFICVLFNGTLSISDYKAGARGSVVG